MLRARRPQQALAAAAVAGLVLAGCGDDDATTEDEPMDEETMDEEPMDEETMDEEPMDEETEE